MVLIKNNPRREATYGWYPACADVYRPKNAPRSYDREYLFKSFEGRSHSVAPKSAWSAEGVAARPLTTPSGLHLDASLNAPLLAVTGCRPPTLSSVRVAAERSHAPRAARSAAGGDDGERAPGGRWPLRGGAAAAAGDPLQPAIPTPSRSEIYRRLRSSPSSESVSIPPTPAAAAADEGEPRAAPGRKARAKSAVELRRRDSAAAADAASDPRQPRPKTSAAASSVESSLGRRRSGGGGEKDPVGGDTFHAPPPSAPTAPPENEAADALRSHIRSQPSSVAGEGSDGGDSAPLTAVGSAAPSYDDQLNRFGWRAEIPGDPLKLKVITQRLSYAVSCKEPEVRPNPPNVCVMDNNTFFYNTIPRRPMSFTVHPEWQSELFVAKRIDLERRGAAKFHTRNFAFAY